MYRATTVTLVILLCGTVLVLAGCGGRPTGTAVASDAEQMGRDAAQRDLKKGILKLKTPPLPNPPWQNQYEKLLRDRGVTLEAVSKFTDPQVKAEMAGYNAVMTARIESKFGPGIIGRLEAEAQGKAK